MGPVGLQGSIGLQALKGSTGVQGFWGLRAPLKGSLKVQGLGI